MGKFSGILLASDLDGTLLSGHKTVSAGNRQAIEYFMAEGGLFCPATGRSLHGFATVEPEVPYNTPCVLFNGSCVYDYASGEAVRTAPLRGSYVQACREVLDAFPELPLEVHNLHMTYVYRGTAFNDEHMRVIGAPYAAAALADIPQPWLKAVFCDEHDILRAVQRWMRKRYGGIFDCVFSHKYLLELQDLVANKGDQVAYVAKRFGVRRVYAVGDGENDLSLARFELFAPQMPNGR